MKRFSRLTLMVPLALSVAMVASCGAKQSDTETDAQRAGLYDSTIVNYYMMGVEGQYGRYVASMQSCDGTTPAYKQQVELALKHRNDCVMKQKKGVKRVGVVRVEMHSGNTMANAFLDVQFNDSSREEILFPLVLDNGHWRMQ